MAKKQENQPITIPGVPTLKDWPRCPLCKRTVWMRPGDQADAPMNQRCDCGRQRAKPIVVIAPPTDRGEISSVEPHDLSETSPATKKNPFTE